MGKRNVKRGMSARVRRELRDLREKVRFLLAGRRCCFCGELFVQGDVQYGTADGPAYRLKLSLHHDNENRADNREEVNVKLAHRSCHKAHHAAEQARRRKQTAEACTVLTRDELMELVGMTSDMRFMVTEQLADERGWTDEELAKVEAAVMKLEASEA